MAEDKLRAFVIGHPIAHSRSPIIHNYWLERYAIPGSYEALDIAPAGIEAFLDDLPASRFVGGNVTIPHKQRAFDKAVWRDDAAEAVEAVNTLWVQEGRICGGNTDIYGFLANLDDQHPGWRNCNCALVLGAGGAARAIVYALAGAGMEKIIVANRTQARADDVAKRFGRRVSTCAWDDLNRAAANADLIVNTTAIGMKGEGCPPLDLACLPQTAIVHDIVYVPLMTPLLEEAQQRGLAVVNGLGMLLHQAVPAFQQWFGVRPEVTEELRSLIVANVEAGG